MWIKKTKATVPVMSAFSKTRFFWFASQRNDGFAGERRGGGVQAAMTQMFPLFPTPMLNEPVFQCHNSPHQITPCMWKPSIAGTEQLCAETASNGCCTLYCNMATEGTLLRTHPNLLTSSQDRLLFVLHYHLFTLFSVFCRQSPAEVTVSQPTLTANGTNG